MRAVFLGLILGAMTMVATEADAGQEKKEVVKEAITFRQWIASEKKFLNPMETKAERFEFKGNPYWRIYNSESVPAAHVGSEITDKDGIVWVIKLVIQEEGAGSRRCKVEKKDPPKP